MINNLEKELLLKLLMEKATKVDSVNLQLVENTQPKRKSKRFRKSKGSRAWTLDEHNFLKQAIVAGRGYSEIAKLLDRSTKSIESRVYLMKTGRVA
jgi:hypothetical protein